MCLANCDTNDSDPLAVSQCPVCGNGSVREDYTPPAVLADLQRVDAAIVQLRNRLFQLLVEAESEDELREAVVETLTLRLPSITAVFPSGDSSESPTQFKTGRVKYVDAQSGYGYLLPAGEQDPRKAVLFDRSAVGGEMGLQPGDEVEYSTYSGNHLVAEAVRPAGSA